MLSRKCLAGKVQRFLMTSPLLYNLATREARKSDEEVCRNTAVSKLTTTTFDVSILPFFPSYHAKLAYFCICCRLTGSDIGDEIAVQIAVDLTKNHQASTVRCAEPRKVCSFVCAFISVYFYRLINCGVGDLGIIALHWALKSAGRLE